MNESALGVPARTRIGGTLLPGEDHDRIAHALVHARDLVLTGAAELLVHADQEANATPERHRALRQSRLHQLAASTLKRYAFRLDTGAGARVIKIGEVTTCGNTLLGATGWSPARREHHLHGRAQAAGLAATETRGFLDWRRSLRLLRSAHVQLPVAPDLLPLSVFFAREIKEHGDAAVEPLAQALAALHAVPFFHADVKSYHAFVRDVLRAPGRPATYRLVWIDLGRVSFWMSPRKRIINLYQALRFILPDRAEAQGRFVAAYCRAAQWRAGRVDQVLRSVRRFLAHKLTTVPAP